MLLGLQGLFQHQSRELVRWRWHWERTEGVTRRRSKANGWQHSCRWCGRRGRGRASCFGACCR
jgi:hypothetical protein